MKAKYQAMIYIPNPFLVEVYFARPLDSDVFSALKGFFEPYEGFEVKVMEHLQGGPLWVKPSPLYDTLDVAKEVEKILRSHGFESLSIRIDRQIGASVFKSTLID